MLYDQSLYRDVFSLEMPVRGLEGDSWGVSDTEYVRHDPH